MNVEELKKLCEQNEVPLFNRGGRTRTPPFYFNSLRHALGFYFQTFHTTNHLYDFYAVNSVNRANQKNHTQYLDEDNTVQTIVAFERFFELYIKDILARVDRRLTYISTPPVRKDKAQEIIKRIRNNTFAAKKEGNKYLRNNFRESLDILNNLFVLEKQNGKKDAIVLKFKKVLQTRRFLESAESESTFRVMSWYRDRILHNGNKLPALRVLDFLISQRVIPVVKNIVDAEQNSLGKSTFYFTTATGINVIEKICALKFSLRNLRDVEKKRLPSVMLYLGHLKELGRANMNMNLFVRNNHQATYEYNYKDPIGRSLRLANAERKTPEFKTIKKCPCCAEKALVVYEIQIDDFFNPGSKENIGWVKCYLCDYHLRYNAGEPKLFGLNDDDLFIGFD